MSEEENPDLQHALYGTAVIRIKTNLKALDLLDLFVEPSFYVPGKVPR